MSTHQVQTLEEFLKDETPTPSNNPYDIIIDSMTAEERAALLSPGPQPSKPLFTETSLIWTLVAVVFAILYLKRKDWTMETYKRSGVLSLGVICITAATQQFSQNGDWSFPIILTYVFGFCCLNKFVSYFFKI